MIRHCTKLSLSKIILISSLIMISILIIFIQNIKILCLFSIIELIYGLILLFLHNGNIVSICSMFWSISFIFHIGDVIFVELFGCETILPEIYSNAGVLIFSVKFIFFSHALLLLGMLLPIKNKKKKRHFIQYLNTARVRWIAFACLIIGIYPKFYMDIQQYLLRKSGGYLNTYSFDKSGIGGRGTLYYLGMELLLFTLKDNKKLAKKIVLLAPCGEIFALLSGNRFYSIVFILVLIYIYTTFIQKVDSKNILFYICIFIVLCIVISVIRETRMESFSAAENVNMLDYFITKNPIIGAIQELGGSIKTVVWCRRFVPDRVNYAYGRTYTDSFIRMIPGIKLINFDSDYLSYVSTLPYNLAMGGSWIAELYYNFSAIGAIFSYILGYVLAKIDKKFVLVFNEKNYFQIVIHLPLIFYIFYYIRNAFACFYIAANQIYVLLAMCFVLQIICYKKGKGDYFEQLHRTK